MEYYDRDRIGCLVLDIIMLGMSGLDLQYELKKSKSLLPIIFITGHGEIPMALEVIKEGALDFLQKLFQEKDLIDRINGAFKFNIKSQHNINDKKKS